MALYWRLRLVPVISTASLCFVAGAVEDSAIIGIIRGYGGGIAGYARCAGRAEFLKAV